jgi:mevalonate kinase
MSSLVLSVPGKSFIAGEYLALKEGPSLLMASKPRFELRAQSGDGSVTDIHPESPAGKLIRDHFEFFQNWDLEFVDPHEGRGGWGASTAQFLCAFVMNEWRESCDLETLNNLSISRLLESYWKYAWNGEGHRPSGSDLMAQYKGALTLFEKRAGSVANFSWLFPEIDFALIATGKKVATHEHLKALPDFDETAIEAAMKQIRASLQTFNSEDFVSGIRANGEALAELGLVASHTQDMLKVLLQRPGVLAAKGCGALGADVILVVYNKKATEEFAGCIGSKDLTHGLQIQVKK